MRRSRATVWLAMALTALTAQARANQAAGAVYGPPNTLTGLVVSEGGEPLRGAFVSAREAGTGQTVSDVTGPDGRFRLFAPGGTWTVKVELAGYQESEQGPARLADSPAPGLDLRFTLSRKAPCEPVEFKVRDLYTGAHIGGATLRVHRAPNPRLKPDPLVTDSLGRASGDFCWQSIMPRIGITYALSAKARDYRPTTTVFTWNRTDPAREDADTLFLIPLPSTPSLGGDQVGIGLSSEFGPGTGVDWTFNDEKVSDTRDGQPAGGTTSQDLAAAELFELLAEFKQDFFDLSYGFGSGGDAAEARRSRAAVSPSTPPRRSVPRGTTLFNVGVGRSRFDVEYDKIDDTSAGGRDTLWTGSGTSLRAGVAHTIAFGRGRGAFASLAYQYERMPAADMTRSPALDPAGGRLLADEGRLGQRSHSLRLVAGWGGRRVSPWAGLRVRWERLRLEGEAGARFDLPQGAFERRISFVNELQNDRVLADFGLDARIPRTRLFLRAWGATDGSDVRFGLGVSHAWFKAR